MPLPRGGNKVTAHDSEGGEPGGSEWGEPGGEPGGGGDGREINDYLRQRDEFDSFEPIILWPIRSGGSHEQIGDIIGEIYINSHSESVEKEGEHEEVDKEILDIKWELEPDPDLENVIFPDNLMAELLTQGIDFGGGGGSSSGRFNEFTHIFEVRINDVSEGFINNYLWDIRSLDNYNTKQDTFKYYRDITLNTPNRAPLNSIKDYFRFWVKLTQKDSNKSVQIPIYLNIPKKPTPGPTPHPPVG